MAERDRSLLPTKSKLRKFTLLFLVASIATALAFIRFGIDFRYWDIYGVFFTEIFVDRIGSLGQDACIQNAYANLGIIRHFHIFSQMIYQIPLLFLMLSATVKIVEIFILTKIFDRMGLDYKYSILFSIAVIFFYGLSATVPPHGIFGPPSYLKSAISSLLTLFGLYLLLDEKYVAGPLFIGLASHFHMPYGLTSFVFIYAAYFCLYIQKKQYNRLILFTLIPVLVIMPLAIQIAGIDKLADHQLSMEQWHRFIMRNGIPGNDSLVVAGIMDVGHIFWLPIAVYYILKNNDGPRDIKEWFMITGIAVTLLSLILEALHFNGIFFGKISEIFISIQMRRGIWIPYIMSCISCLILFYDQRDRFAGNWQMIFPIFAITFFFYASYVLGFCLAIAMTVCIFEGKKNKSYYSFPIIYIYLMLINYLYISPSVADEKSWLFMHFDVFLFAVIFLILSTKVFQKMSLFIKVGGMVAVFVLLSVGKSAKSFYGEISELHNRGWLAPISWTELDQWVQPTRPLSAITSYLVYEKMSEINPNREVVFYPLEVGYLEGKFPSVFAPYWCYIQSTHSRGSASYFHQLVEKIYNTPVDPQDLWTPRMNKLHYALSADRIQSLFDQNIMSFFISTRDYPELKKAATVREYYIYQK